MNYRSQSDFAAVATLSSPRLSPTASDSTECASLPAASGVEVASITPLRRLLERVAAFVLLIPCLPVIAVVWAAVKLTSPGPGLYRQLRSGWQGRGFDIFKLRTMTHNCEQHTGAVWSVPGDSRVTPLGKFLRASHLDELPQLFNVLRGEMAIVGPRPERPEIIESLVTQIPGYLDRLQVLPGVTGLSQIFHQPDRNVDDVRRKVQIDREYIRCRSVWLDLRIVFCTALKMVGMNRSSLRTLLFPVLSRRLEQESFVPRRIKK